MSSSERKGTGSDGATRVPRVSEAMTRNPATISLDSSLAVAHALMREKRIRHLPVVNGEELVGMLSLGDLDLVEALKDSDLTFANVIEAMTQNPYCVAEDDPLEAVAETMAKRKIGSAIVVDAQRTVVGIFTAVDGLRILARLLRGARPQTTKRPG